MATITVPSRFRGPPDSGNGGWVCGTLARQVEGYAEVTLKAPPPLETELSVATDGPVVRLTDGERVIAEAVETELDVEWPPFVSLQTAQEAAARYPGFETHAFGSCFTCGPERAEGDGLRLFSGPVTDEPELVACPWQPHESVLDDDGSVPDAIVWAALDCPSGWSHIQHGRVAVLGRMAVHIDRRPRPGEPCVVVGRADAVDGRKLASSSALYTADGAPLAVARATWIEIEADRDQAPR